MTQISLDSLNNHLFETIEMLKNNSDPVASENEKIDIKTAKAIAELGKIIVEAFKVKAHVLNMINNSGDLNPNEMKTIAIDAGFSDKIES
jgi:hypothetical protein